MQTATTDLICLRQFESSVLFSSIFYFRFVICLQNERGIIVSCRADQNMGVALLEFTMRTAMSGKSRFSSAISVCDNSQSFEIGFSTVAVAQWVSRWNSGHRVVQAEGSTRVEIHINFFSNDFYFSFVRPNGLQ